jgi:regulator of replication initiation timing
MSNVIDVSSLIETKNLKIKVARLQNELDVYYKNIEQLKNENTSLNRQNLTLKEENQELRKYLESLGTIVKK